METRFQIVGPPIPDVCTDCIILGKLDSFLHLRLIYSGAMAVLRIHDILGLIRILRRCPSRRQLKTNLKKSLSAYYRYFLKVH